MRLKLPFGRRRAPELDELGGTADGALAIVVDDVPIHVAPKRITAALRYFVARAQSPGVDRLPGSLAITSALRGEGVSYVTKSLGAVLAYDADASVVVVDLNWELPGGAEKKRRLRRKSAAPTPTKPAAEAADGHTVAAADPATDDSAAADRPEAVGQLEAGSRPTLVDAVEGRAELDEIVQTTANPQLSLIAAGPVPLARRPAMASSRELEKVMRQIAGRFDHVLLDLPPVLASSDAIRLAQLADAFILVVRQGVTTTNQVDTALTQLRATESLGVILNRFDSRIPRPLRKIVEA